jgi:RNA polymerase sigma-70 factor (ECF subfamily)
VRAVSASEAGARHALDDPKQGLAILSRLGAGDERALRELHALLGRRIVAFVLHRTNDMDMAQTVMVDTLMEVWKHPGRFRGESRLSTWVLGIARYKLLTALRQRDEATDDIDDHAETLESDLPETSVQVERLQEREHLRLCMDRLSGVQRECLHLLFFEGLTVEEISGVQGVPQGTVKTRLMHGRRQMKQCLETEGYAR